MVGVPDRRARRRDRWGQAIVVMLAVIAGLVAAWLASPRDADRSDRGVGDHVDAGIVGGVEQTTNRGGEPAATPEE